MGKIASQIDAVRRAVYGRDVRESIASGLEAWDEYNEETLAAIQSADAKLTQSQATLNALNSANSTAVSRKSALDTVISDATTVHADLQALVNDADSIAEMRDRMNEIPGEVLGAYFGMGRTGKLYQTKVPKFANSQSSLCVKLGANASMVCEPSTDTTTGRDDYQASGELLFKWWRCNYVRDADGFARPIAYEGDADFKTSGNVDVGTLCPTFYYSYLDKTDHYLLTVSDSPNSTYNLKPFEAAVRQDGTVEPYFIHQYL